MHFFAVVGRFLFFFLRVFGFLFCLRLYLCQWHLFQHFSLPQNLFATPTPHLETFFIPPSSHLVLRISLIVETGVKVSTQEKYCTFPQAQFGRKWFVRFEWKCFDQNREQCATKCAKGPVFLFFKTGSISPYSRQVRSTPHFFCCLPFFYVKGPPAINHSF